VINKKDLITQEEVDACLDYLSRNNSNGNNSAQEQLLKVLQETQISLDEPIIEDSIDSARIRITYPVTIHKKSKDDRTIRFQYIKEMPIDYSSVPIRLKGTAAADSNHAPVDEYTSTNNDKSAIGQDTITESYDELEDIVPRLHEILGHLKKIYFMPEDFSNRLVVDRIHALRNIFSKDEVLSFPSIDLSNKAGLIPL